MQLNCASMCGLTFSTTVPFPVRIDRDALI